ncbi:MAG: DUF4058 family protein [Planctomycetaceae bacterium]|nr:DUF4058 family protein [Planctomycetaceae bacterium]MBV8557433.1 DUF4058 family protein [Planctomycetaceae bacterium]
MLVSRAKRRPAADFRPIHWRDRLPLIPIPLRAPDGDARVDLQGVLHRAHHGPGPEHFIDAGTTDPPLPGEDAAWARPFVPQPG